MKHILYTEEEGGNFKYIAYKSDEETVAKFHEIIEKRRFEFRTSDKITRVIPAYIALVEDVDGYDFVINKRRIGLELLPDKEEDAK